MSRNIERLNSWEFCVCVLWFFPGIVHIWYCLELVHIATCLQDTVLTTDAVIAGQPALSTNLQNRRDAPCGQQHAACQPSQPLKAFAYIQWLSFVLSPREDLQHTFPTKMHRAGKSNQFFILVQLLEGAAISHSTNFIIMRYRSSF